MEHVRRIVWKDLLLCERSQQRLFQTWAVEPYHAPRVRYDRHESVVVVARRNDEVLYWEDVEEGFNVSRVDSCGNILQHWCNQDALGIALQRWSFDIKNDDLAPAQEIKVRQ